MLLQKDKIILLNCFDFEKSKYPACYDEQFEGKEIFFCECKFSFVWADWLSYWSISLIFLIVGFNDLLQLNLMLKNLNLDKDRI